jgi:sortase A
MVWRVVSGIGRILVAAGVLVLLFVAYLLWGTDISASSHQRTLHAEFEHALAARSSTTTTVPSSSGPTVPSNLVKDLTTGQAPAEGQPVAELQIPKIGLDTVVVQGTATDDLHLGPGHYDGTPLPGQVGNVAIASHRTTFGAPFYHLDELAAGDPIVLTTLQGRFTYDVVRTLIVSPSDGSVIAPSTTPMLTLTTCNPRFSASQRLVVQADLTGTPAPSPPAEASAKPSKHPKSGNLAGTQGDWIGAALWGAGGVALAVGLWLAVRARRRPVRWVTYGAGVLPMLVLLYFFFENVQSLLPASY